MSAVVSSIVFFRLGIELAERYDELSEGLEVQQAQLEDLRKMGLETLYASIRGDIRRSENITKLNMNFCLTMLAFEKEKQN
ncbi:MAG: hypothetical protein CM15mV90_070 [uncultured marine virus]|nr:MAG: hypothetical protein CM15mV90_070 [uncultured marine virus]